MIDFLWPFKLPETALRVAYWAGARDGAMIAVVALLILYLFHTRRTGGNNP